MYRKGCNYMKHIWVCLLLFCTLCLAFSCSLAAQYPYQTVDSERIEYSLPVGLSAKVTKGDGLLNILIDSEKTDWDQLVTNIDASARSNIELSAKKPNQNITEYHQINLRRDFFPDRGTSIEQAYDEFDHIINREFAHKRPSNFYPYYNTWEVAVFDVQSSTLLPAPTNDSFCVAHLVVWNPNSSNPIYEYFFVNISFTDDSAHKVSMSNVPRSRIFAYTDVNMDTTIEAGCVTYKIPLDHALCGNQIYTGIAAPSGAKAWREAGKDTLHPLGTITANGTAIPGTSIPQYIRNTTQAETVVLPIIWFSDEAGTQVLKFERLSWDYIVGTPDPFPRYMKDLTAVPKDRIFSVIWNRNESVSSLPYISATYAATQDDFDTFRIAVDPVSVPDDVNLDALAVEQFILPPKGAVAYTAEGRSRDTILGEMPYYFKDNYEPKLTDPAFRCWDDIVAYNGKEYLFAGGLRISTSKPFKHDPDLRLYTEAENSSPYAGDVSIIYWYDSFDPDDEPILKEYFIRKMDPFTLEKVQPAYTDESQLPPPDKMTLPVIIISKGEEITDLYLVIEKVPTSNSKHIYYDLYVVDADGNERKLGGDAIVIIPYPDARLGKNAPYSFKVAHYHNGKKLEYTEENGLLWRTEHGLAFKTKDFSPFILTWEESDSDPAGIGDPAGVENLPQTGDSSVPLVILLTMLAAAVTGLCSLSKRRA